MQEKRESSERIQEAKGFFETYRKEIGTSIRGNKRVMNIDFEELTEFSHELAEELLNYPIETINDIETALDEGGLIKNPRVRFSNIPETQDIRISHIRAKHLDKLISISGIVRKTSEVRPRVVNAKFECPSCGTISSVLQVDSKFREPTRCSCGRRGQFKLRTKDMVDAQRIVIEESPESLIGGEQPGRMDVFLQEDLVEPKMEERTTPGSRVKVIGTLKDIPITLQTGAIKTTFNLVIEANNIIPLEETFEEMKTSEEDERQIQELAADEKIFDKLAQSIAPSIWGYEEIKKALVLQMFGGVRKTNPDRSVRRGDIHILLTGDPGVAKSIILKFVSEIAPKGRYIVGKAATGAGITATVVKDELLRGWSLEAGAMVLANKGVLCIDELEKMDEKDRSAMHEALEQQTVTISKANIQASLQAQTSVLAAGNPTLGRFEPFQQVARQIGLPPTLINRFDIIFILKDIPEKNRDELIAQHVLLGHQKHAFEIPVARDMFRKYISYAKRKCYPVLTDEAVKEIKDFYVKIRTMPISSKMPMSPVPISARQLEAIIRLAEAHAKLRLSKDATKEDAREAIRLMKYYLDTVVGIDKETGVYDIDKISIGITTSQRNKVILMREAIARLEERLGKLIETKELEKELEGKLSKDDIDDSLQKLTASGDVFSPRRGFIQRIA